MLADEISASPGADNAIDFHPTCCVEMDRALGVENVSLASFLPEPMRTRSLLLAFARLS